MMSGLCHFISNNLNVPSVLELSIQEDMLGEEPRLSKMGQKGSRKEKGSDRCAGAENTDV